MFEKVILADTDQALLTAVRSHQGKNWAATIADIKAYRKRLLELQNYRCAYCQGIIDLDEVGHRELDHIFPKSASKDCTEGNGRSNDNRLRQHTFGYPQFTYEPLNMIVTCKICNAFKKSHDPLLDRANAYTSNDYPVPDSILWFYPYEHRYSEHIERTENWTYKRLSAQGEEVIRVCKLDKAAVLESRFLVRALIAVKQASNLRSAFTRMATHVFDKVCSMDQVVEALSGSLNLAEEICTELIRLKLRYLNEGGILYIEKFEAILATIAVDETLNAENAAQELATGDALPA